MTQLTPVEIARRLAGGLDIDRSNGEFHVKGVIGQAAVDARNGDAEAVAWFMSPDSDMWFEWAELDKELFVRGLMEWI